MSGKANYRGGVFERQEPRSGPPKGYQQTDLGTWEPAYRPMRIDGIELPCPFDLANPFSEALWGGGND